MKSCSRMWKSQPYRKPSNQGLAPCHFTRTMSQRGWCVQGFRFKVKSVKFGKPSLPEEHFCFCADLLCDARCGKNAMAGAGNRISREVVFNEEGRNCGFDWIARDRLLCLGETTPRACDRERALSPHSLLGRSDASGL